MQLYAYNDKQHFMVNYVCPYSGQMLCQYLPKESLTSFISVYGSACIINFIWY